jgi:hypothetical protein
MEMLQCGLNICIMWIKNENLTFGQDIELLKDGKIVSRWRWYREFVFLSSDFEMSIPEAMLLKKEGTFPESPVVAAQNSK